LFEKGGFKIILHGRKSNIRVGHGFDVHRFEDVRESDANSRPLILMGCVVTHDRALVGHSDADVMLHALIDALLGAAGLGDIGQHFPDTDQHYLNISSIKLLETVVKKIHEKKFEVINVDICLIGELPKIGSYRNIMRERVAPVLCVDLTAVNIKATTTENLGFTGRGEGLAAQAVVLLELIELPH
jgi:2-C-methyl-D-erythritol 2,4-cyclodiphosphate synthase